MDEEMCELYICLNYIEASGPYDPDLSRLPGLPQGPDVMLSKSNCLPQSFWV